MPSETFEIQLKELVESTQSFEQKLETLKLRNMIQTVKIMHSLGFVTD